MAVSEDEVRHVAALSRLGLEADRIPRLAEELSGILAHMDVLAAVDTSTVDLHARADGHGMPLRPDAGPSLGLAHAREDIAPSMRDGFFLVPRLATHDDGDDPA